MPRMTSSASAPYGTGEQVACFRNAARACGMRCAWR
jgi:hypothetical protein